MHAPYAAQYCVIGGSGAGNGGSFTPDVAAVCAAPAAVSEAPLSAMLADAGVAAAVAAFAELADFVAAAVAVVAVVAVLTPGPLAAGAAAAAGMLAPGGAAEKLLGGKGGREGAPVEDVLVATGWRGGNCDSCAMLTLVCLLAAA